MPSGSSIHISVRPQGSAAGSRMTGTPVAASRACSARTSRTWIQIITERPGWPSACPETSSNPGRGRTPPRDRRGARTPGRWPSPARRGRSGGCSPGRRAAGGSGCSEHPHHHFSIVLSEAEGQGERAQSRRSVLTSAGFGQDNGCPDPSIRCLCSVAGRTSVAYPVIPGCRYCPSPGSGMGSSVAARDRLS